MNGKITFCIMLAFLFSFSSFLILYSFSPGVHTDRNNHPFFNEKLSTDKKNIFLIGSSHVGQLNTTHIIKDVNASSPQYDVYNLAINSNHELIGKILSEKTNKKRVSLINQLLDLALLSQGILKGESLTKFINRSVDMIN